MSKQESPRLDDEFIKSLLSSDPDIYFQTRSLNKKLYIHFKGLKKLENLSDFTNLKVLYAESNFIEKIESLDACTELRCLYLQGNQIKEMTGTENLSKLHTINLSGNQIQKIESLENKPHLTSLLLSQNLIGKSGVSDLEELIDLENLSVLDLSNNLIDDEEVLKQVIYRLPKLSVLYFAGNPVCGKMKGYRKELINFMPGLKYLDNHPVFESERRFAQAFVKKGIRGEREEREKWNKEQEEEKNRNRLAFREMIEKKRMAERAKAESTSESANESGGSQVWSSSTDSECESAQEERKVDYDDVE